MLTDNDVKAIESVDEFKEALNQFLIENMDEAFIKWQQSSEDERELAIHIGEMKVYSQISAFINSYYELFLKNYEKDFFHLWDEESLSEITFESDSL